MIMLIAKYYDRLEIEWGKLTRVVSGIPINKKYKYLDYDFYKEDEDGNAFSRNLYSSSMCGYRIAFPGTPLSGYAGMGHAVEEDYRILDHRIKCFPSKDLSQSDRNMFVWCYPDFKYVLNKWHPASIAQALEVLSIWKEHKEIELLLAGGYENIAFNKNFWRLSEKKRKEIALFLRMNEKKDYTLLEVQERLKYKLNEEEYKDFCKWNSRHHGANVSYKLYKYLIRQEEKYGYESGIKERYTDYKKAFKSHYCHHEFKDDYWVYPSDLYSFHDRVVEEINNAIILEREQEKAEKEKDKRNKLQRLKRVAEKYSVYNGNVDGFYFYFSPSIKDWTVQASKLHQCIVASDYYGGMAKKKYLIAFIRKDNEPVATVQIYKNKEIGQFYGNETDRNNCKPSEEVQKAFNKWLGKLPALEVI